MKKIFFAILKYVIAFGIAGFLVWLSLSGLSPQDKVDIKTSLLNARYIVVLPVFTFMFISHWLRTMRWQQMILPLGYKPPVFDLFCGLLVGYITNQLIPRAGEIVRCTVIAKQQKIPLEKLIGTVVAERLVDFFCLLILTAIMFFLEYAYIKQYAFQIISVLHGWMQSHAGWQQGIIFFTGLLVIFFLFYLVRKKSAKWKKIFSHILKGLWEGLVSTSKVENKLMFFVYTFFMWGCYITSIWAASFAFRETFHIKFGTSLAMLIFGTFGIIVSPGGLGAYPYAIQKTLMFYGFSRNTSIAFGWLLWLTQFLFTIIFGLLAYIALTIRNKKDEKPGIRTA